MKTPVDNRPVWAAHSSAALFPLCTPLFHHYLCLLHCMWAVSFSLSLSVCPLSLYADNASVVCWNSVLRGQALGQRLMECLENHLVRGVCYCAGLCPCSLVSGLLQALWLIQWIITDETEPVVTACNDLCQNTWGIVIKYIYFLNLWISRQWLVEPGYNATNTLLSIYLYFLHSFGSKRFSPPICLSSPRSLCCCCCLDWVTTVCACLSLPYLSLLSHPFLVNCKDVWCTQFTIRAWNKHAVYSLLLLFLKCFLCGRAKPFPFRLHVAFILLGKVVTKTQSLSSGAFPLCHFFNLCLVCNWITAAFIIVLHTDTSS